MAEVQSSAILYLFIPSLENGFKNIYWYPLLEKSGKLRPTILSISYFRNVGIMF